MTPPDTLIPYLSTKGSLTALLERRAGQPLRVQVLFEGYARMDFYHKKLLGLSMSRPAVAWVREVLLFGDGDVAWVRAKSIFPLQSLTGNAKRLRHLKRTPIGYVLFKHTRQLPHTRTPLYDGQYWGRNTVYDWYGRKLRVKEKFLTTL